MIDTKTRWSAADLAVLPAAVACSLSVRSTATAIAPFGFAQGTGLSAAAYTGLPARDAPR